MNRKERPKCRRVIARLLKERNCTLQELLAGSDGFSISDGLKIQVRKMIQENA